MNQNERLQYLIRSLLQEKTEYRQMAIPMDAPGQRKLLLPEPARGRDCGRDGAAVQVGNRERDEGYF